MRPAAASLPSTVPSSKHAVRAFEACYAASMFGWGLAGMAVPLFFLSRASEEGEAASVSANIISHAFSAIFIAMGVVFNRYYYVFGLKEGVASAAGSRQLEDNLSTTKRFGLRSLSVTWLAMALLTHVAVINALTGKQAWSPLLGLFYGLVAESVQQLKFWLELRFKYNVRTWQPSKRLTYTILQSSKLYVPVSAAFEMYVMYRVMSQIFGSAQSALGVAIYLAAAIPFYQASAQRAATDLVQAVAHLYTRVVVADNLEQRVRDLGLADSELYRLLGVLSGAGRGVELDATAHQSGFQLPGSREQQEQLNAQQAAYNAYTIALQAVIVRLRQLKDSNPEVAEVIKDLEVSALPPKWLLQVPFVGHLAAFLSGYGLPLQRYPKVATAVGTTSVSCLLLATGTTFLGIILEKSAGYQPDTALPNWALGLCLIFGLVSAGVSVAMRVARSGGLFKELVHDCVSSLWLPCGRGDRLVTPTAPVPGR